MGRIMDVVTVEFLRVGQGDSTIIVDHETHQAMVIDCPVGYEHIVIAALRRHGAELDTAVITHFDNDHSAGVIALIDSVPCRELVSRVNVGRRTNSDEAQHRRIVARITRGESLCVPRRNDEGFLGASLRRVQWRVLSPDGSTDFTAYTGKNRNRSSIVLRLEVLPTQQGGASATVLVSGDADGFVWQKLLTAGDDLACDAALWPHHGGRMGSSKSGLPDRFLAASNPKLVVVSAGSKNGYKHPRGETLAAIRNSGARLACTEVTPFCHAMGANSAPTACAGDVKLHIDESGSVTVSPSLPEHLLTIANWTDPKCIV